MLDPLNLLRLSYFQGHNNVENVKIVFFLRSLDHFTLIWCLKCRQYCVPMLFAWLKCVAWSLNIIILLHFREERNEKSLKNKNRSRLVFFKCLLPQSYDGFIFSPFKSSNEDILLKNRKGWHYDSKSKTGCYEMSVSLVPFSLKADIIHVYINVIICSYTSKSTCCFLLFF